MPVCLCECVSIVSIVTVLLEVQKQRSVKESIDKVDFYLKDLLQGKQGSPQLSSI